MSNSVMEGYRRVLEILAAMPKGKNIQEQALRDAMTVELGVVAEEKLVQHRQIMVRLGLIIPVQNGIGVMDRFYQIGEKGIELLHPDQVPAAKKPRQRKVDP